MDGTGDQTAGKEAHWMTALLVGVAGTCTGQDSALNNLCSITHHTTVLLGHIIQVNAHLQYTTSQKCSGTEGAVKG